MPFWLALLLMPISAAGVILSALKIKNKTAKILGIVLSSIVFALMLAYTILVLVFVFRDDDPYDDPDPNSQFVVQIEGMTDNEDGTFTYDDGEISLTFEQVTPDDTESDIADAPSVLKGESCGNEWTVVSDDDGVPKTVYVTSGDTTVSAAVNKAPDDGGKEYTASIAAALVTDKKPYSENKDGDKYRTDSSSFYIEEASCLLYYPAQLKAFSQKGNSYIFRDKKSSASLKVTLSPNEYTSMAEVEGFIKNTENNLVLAYGPNWFTSESKKNGKVTFGYSGFGSRYIVEAELIYPEKNSEIFDDLRKLIKCCFVGDGIWKSKASSEGYSKDKSTAYSDKFSRETAAYYSEKYGVILLYPEIFSEVGKTDEYVFFTDPVTGAEIAFFADPDCISLADWAQAYGFDESYVDGERRVKASVIDGGTYAVMYLTDNENVCAVLTYPEEYAWVYEEFEDKFTIVASGSEIRNIEMQTVFIEEYGALITMPLQFEETSFYDGIIRYKDGLNGMEMSVSFDYLTSEKERKNLFACFDVIADDEDIFVGDSYVRWLSNQGFFYGARGNDMKALMQIDSPNAEKAYESTLPMFCVEFVTEESKEETKAQTLAQEANAVEDMSDPPEETSVSSAEIAYPNKVLVYKNDADCAYAMTDGEYWYSFERERIEKYGEFDPGSGFLYFSEQKDIVDNIIKILKYNNYDIDHLGAEYMKKMGINEYDEERMLQKLTADTEFKMFDYYKCRPRHDSDLGKETPSVLEAICEILEIEKPDYVRDREETAEQTTAAEKTEQTETKASQTTAAENQSKSEAVSSKLDKYRINDGDASHDAEFGYNERMADTIGNILAKYDENDIDVYITDVYGDERLVDITDKMYIGKYDDDYGFTTTLVYILSKYSDDAVIGAMADGNSLPAKTRYIYFHDYDDYGTGWGEPYASVWLVSDKSRLGEFELLADTELCGYIYDAYGDVILGIAESSYDYDKVPFWINGWETSVSKAAYCRDFIVPAAISTIDEYCGESDEFTMDCLFADAETIKFNAGGKSRTGIKITALDQIYDGYDPAFDSMEFYLDLKTGILYDSGFKNIGSILG